MRVARDLTLAALALAATAGLGAQQPADATRGFASPADYATDITATPATVSELRDAFLREGAMPIETALQWGV
ncbi:MAG TPA: hypothetical protein VGY48_26360 [Vicinamibacterales bacterium]|jgi:hypothetical protein|nr:hypothetical protein [Vicinamibacterales bacterium]